MPANNLSWFFNVEYFEGDEGSDNNAFKFIHLKKNDKRRKEYESERNKQLHKKILRYKFPEYKPQKISDKEESIILQVEYPGLMTGVGYPHAAGTEGEACAGCSLDYVTGLPYIPGSSLKGILRSAFRHKDYIKELLEDEEADVEAIEEDIFENSDVFLDSFPIDGMCNGVLDIENITPHHNTPLGTLSEPVPLTFVKVKPDVVFEFRFILNDSDIITAEKKLELFRQIILDLGIGAKTNVGFGRFTDKIKPVFPAKTPSAEFTPDKPQFGKHEEGTCRGCGKPVTKINKYTNKPFPYCYECNQKRK